MALFPAAWLVSSPALTAGLGTVRGQITAGSASQGLLPSAPYILIGSPHCTDWCTLNRHLNHRETAPAEVAA